MDIEKAQEVAQAYRRREEIKALLMEVRVAQHNQCGSGVVTLTIPARWLTDIATLALQDIEKYESDIAKL